MKIIVTFILLITLLSSIKSQDLLLEKKRYKKYYTQVNTNFFRGYKVKIYPLTLSFISGASWGLHESTAHHWDKFHNRFPNAKPKFWNPEISWKNKYIDWPENQRRSLVPIFFTDAKHMLASTTQVSLFCAGITVTIGKKRPWQHYAFDSILSFASYSIGNYITYDLIYK